MTVLDDISARGDSPVAVNAEAEQAVLATLIRDNRAYDRVADLLRAHHFADPAHGRIYEAACKLIERGERADPITLKAMFDADGDLGDVGGSQYLADLFAGGGPAAFAATYARVVYEAWQRRELLLLARQIADEAASDADTPETVAGRVSERLDALVSERAQQDAQDFDWLLEQTLVMADEAARNPGANLGPQTGFLDLDRLLGGLIPGGLVIIAGRPSMGKTAFATQATMQMARGSEPVPGALFTLEMPAQQLMTRIAAGEAGVSPDAIRKGALPTGELRTLFECAQRLRGTPVAFFELYTATVPAIRLRCRRLQRQGKLGVVVVDYLQLLGSAGRHDSRVNEVGEISRALKALALELNVPVVALAQLSRQVENREDKRPILADLRESGSIEQDADVVMFLYREAYYLERAEPQPRPDEANDKYGQRWDAWNDRLTEVRNVAEVIVAKNRHGATAGVRLRFDSETARFGNLDRGY